MFKNQGPGGLFSHGPAKDALILLAAALLLSSPARHPYGGVKALQQPQVAAQEAARAKQASRVTVPDEPVLNQDGKPVNFYTDLVKGKIVLVHFIFTTCEDVCPMQGESLAKLRTLLGDRVGREVQFISVSLDPETDTPARLKAWGKMFGAGPGWSLVTGDQQRIDRIIRAFTGGSTGKGEHAPLFVIGDESKGVWRRANALTEPSRLLRVIDQVGASAPSPK